MFGYLNIMAKRKSLALYEPRCPLIGYDLVYVEGHVAHPIVYARLQVSNALKLA